MSQPIEKRISARLATVRENGLYRQLRSPAGIDLCSNDYLGLAAHPRLKERMIESIRREGCGSTGSRLLRGHREAFTRVEKRFARFKGTESSLYFSTGYAANVSVLTTFVEEGDVVFSDQLNHASIIDGARLSRGRRIVFRHNDVEDLARRIGENDGNARFVVVESLFSMDGDEAPLTDYAALCDATGCALIVDEAHAVGVFGTSGSGLIEESGIGDSVFLSINTAGKALGVSGAFVCGSRTAIDYLVQHARPFIFSTAPPPSVAAGIEAALDLVESEPRRRASLLALSSQLRARLCDRFPIPEGRSQIIPVVIGGNEEVVALASSLQSEGYDVRAVRPPTVAPGTARLRISLNADLSPAVIDDFAGTLLRTAPRLPAAAVSTR
ncbi:MAG TPA: 8-amino-7-oxononanoate synthase [Thermoanaerobaculia bacterium]|nr:8-amino-7-oxononanoate synthase [Thermoanaerobaculia bacterium]